MPKVMQAAAIAGLVGQVIGTSEWVEVTQDRIDLFARATDDFQFIHVDPARAAQTPFGSTIAHGFLTLSLLPMLMERSDCPQAAGVTMGINCGANMLRFLAPVRSGKRVRGVFKLLEIEEKSPGQWQQVIEATVEIEGEPKPALVCHWITRFFVA